MWQVNWYWNVTSTFCEHSEIFMPHNKVRAIPSKNVEEGRELKIIHNNVVGGIFFKDFTMLNIIKYNL